MLSSSKRFSIGLLLCLGALPSIVVADDYAARVEYAELQLTEQGYSAHAQIDYRLSPTAKEALDKGVRLAWNVIIEVREPGPLWQTVISRHELPYSLHFHALLNQYAVQTPYDHSEMFLTLSAAMNFMATIRTAALIPTELISARKPYLLAVKTQFNREFLPIPLRPVAYLDSNWFLSSTWYIWPIPK